MQAVERNKLKLKSIRFVCPQQDSPPNLFLAECDFFSERDISLPPFFLMKKVETIHLKQKRYFVEEP